MGAERGCITSAFRVPQTRTPKPYSVYWCTCRKPVDAQLFLLDVQKDCQVTATARPGRASELQADLRILLSSARPLAMGNPPRAAIRQAFGEVALQTTQRFLHLGKLLIPFAFFDRAAAASQNEVTSSNQTWDEAVAADNVIYRDVVSMSTLFNFTDYQLIGRTVSKSDA